MMFHKATQMRMHVEKPSFERVFLHAVGSAFVEL